MRKLLLVLLAVPALSFASSLDMSTLQCRGTKLDSNTTLADVQKDCLIKKQTMSKGRYEVEFTSSDATNSKESHKSVTCYFGTNTPEAKLNSCK